MQGKAQSVIRPDAPMPADLTRRQALFALYAIQEWECLPERPDPYAPGFFYNRIQAILNGVQNISRRTAFGHLALGACIVCHTPIDLRHTTLDHLMPLAEGGPDTPSNTCMLCRRCNSSKGPKDLLEWWLWKGFKVQDLPRTVLCLYARIYWQHLDAPRLAQPIPAATRLFLTERLANLPTDHHRIAFWGAVYAGCALHHWLSQGDRDDERSNRLL